VGQFHFQPERYLELMHSEVPGYDELQEEVARAVAGLPVDDVLDLGTGTGETAARILNRYPEARLTGVDESAAMLSSARAALGNGPVLLVARLEDPLPPGPFDLVVSALAVHHLDGAGKADLFRRVARVLRPRGRFVLGDVVVPEDAADAIVPLTADYDRPDTIADQLAWLEDAGFDARVAWRLRDLTVFAGERP
jgi:tRNA (cmo5U34)-methyltransferase